jgi:hypothetical protein
LPIFRLTAPRCAEMVRLAFEALRARQAAGAEQAIEDG